MKDKKILAFAAAAVCLATGLLFLGVFGAQKAHSSRIIPVQFEDETPSSAMPSSLYAQTTAAQGGSGGQAQSPVFPADANKTLLPLGPVTETHLNLEAEEIIFNHWVEAEPGAADISRAEAIENANAVAEALFNTSFDRLSPASFQKDVTGQRGDYWEIGSEQYEMGLRVLVDARGGQVTQAFVYDQYLRGRVLGEDENQRALMENIHAEASRGQGEYVEEAKRIAGKYFPYGEIVEIEANAVHNDTIHYPAVSLALHMENGYCYDLEWIKDGESGELLLNHIWAYPDRESYYAGFLWEADRIEHFRQIEAWERNEGIETGPAVETSAPVPLPTPPPTPMPTSAVE